MSFEFVPTCKCCDDALLCGGAVRGARGGARSARRDGKVRRIFFLARVSLARHGAWDVQYHNGPSWHTSPYFQ